MAEQITEAAKHRASELIKAEYPPNVLVGSASIEEIDGHYWGSAFARYIMQVSDVVEACRNNCEAVGGLPETAHMLSQFILPEPVDPLDALASQMAGELDVSVSTAKQAIEHLVDTGLIKIVPSNG